MHKEMNLMRYFVHVRIMSLIIGLLVPITAYAGGQSESAASNRGRYLTGLGYIYQPEEILIDSLISKVDYDYPVPQNDNLNVITSADIRDKTGYIQIGLKGKKDTFKNIPPMNISFVIDISGSMASSDKLSWVKDSFYIFINNIRPQDIISVVIFDDTTEVLVAPTQIKNENDRTQFKRKVDTLQPRGGTDIFKGMSLGYTQVALNYRKDYTNRVLLLTDGMHNGSGTKDDIIDVVTRYNANGINISTIALGASADINLMVDMATNGGGSSRFISDHDKMEETFGSELDRLIVPAARMLNMEIVLSEGITLQETWGYKYWSENNSIHYSLDTLHNGDYETLFAIVNLDKMPDVGMKIATFLIRYEDINGAQYRKSYDVILTANALQNTTTINDKRIKEAEGFVSYGKGLIAIGELANSIVKMQQEYQRGQDINVKDQLVTYLSNGIDQIRSLSTHLLEINTSLGGEKYGDEFTTLNNYEKSFTDAYNNYTTTLNRND